MKAWPSGFAVNRAGSLRGIGKVLRRIGEPGPGDPQPLARGTPTRGCRPGQIRARASTRSGMLAAVITASLPPQLIPASAIGVEASASRSVSSHSAMSSSSRRDEGAWPRSCAVGPRAAAVGEVRLVARLGERPAQSDDTSRRGSGRRGARRHAP